MTKTVELTSTMLRHAARMDARRSVSKWAWSLFGLILSVIPFIKVVALIVGCILVFLLIPKIDLSTPEQVRVYSQHPALYTEHYRKTAKMLRLITTLCGWLSGIILLNLI